MVLVEGMGGGGEGCCLGMQVAKTQRYGRRGMQGLIVGGGNDGREGGGGDDVGRVSGWGLGKPGGKAAGGGGGGGGGGSWGRRGPGGRPLGGGGGLEARRGTGGGGRKIGGWWGGPWGEKVGRRGDQPGVVCFGQWHQAPVPAGYNSTPRCACKRKRERERDLRTDTGYCSPGWDCGKGSLV